MEPYTITFFVPCLNEGKNIGPTLQTIHEAVKAFPYRCEVIVVDDGSTDHTFAVTQEIKKDHFPLPLRILRNEKTKGIGHNYFHTAFEAKGKYYMIVNGDNVEPVQTIQKILSELGKADMIIPFFGEGDERAKGRKILSRLFNRMVNFLSGSDILYYNGPVCHLTENVKNSGLKVNGFAFQAELICKCIQEGKTFLEIQVSNRERHWGSSKAFRLKNILSVIGSSFRIFLKRFQK